MNNSYATPKQPPIWNPYGSNTDSSSDNGENPLSDNNITVQEQEENNRTAEDSYNDFNDKD